MYFRVIYLNILNQFYYLKIFYINFLNNKILFKYMDYKEIQNINKIIENKNINKITIEHFIKLFTKNIYDIITDLLNLNLKKFKKKHKKTYNKNILDFVLLFISHIINIFVKKERIIYSGILLILISLMLFFINNINI